MKFTSDQRSQERTKRQIKKVQVMHVKNGVPKGVKKASTEKTLSVGDGGCCLM